MIYVMFVIVCWLISINQSINKTTYTKMASGEQLK